MKKKRHLLSGAILKSDNRQEKLLKPITPISAFDFYSTSVTVQLNKAYLRLPFNSFSYATHSYTQKDWPSLYSPLLVYFFFFYPTHRKNNQTHVLFPLNTSFTLLYTRTRKKKTKLLFSSPSAHSYFFTHTYTQT